jgi:twitching motility protein PilT
MAMEILVPNSAIRNLIREDKTHQIYSIMQSGSERYGMQTLNQSLAALYRKREITLEMGLSISSNPEELKDLCSRRGHVGNSASSGGVAGSRGSILNGGR